MIVFRCGHAYHRECLDQNLEMTTADDLKCAKCGRFSSLSEAQAAQLKMRRVALQSQKLRPKEEYVNEDGTTCVVRVALGLGLTGRPLSICLAQCCFPFFVVRG